MMKIMSFNLLCGGPGHRNWPARTPLVVRTIYNADPDLLGVQEAHIGWMNALRACLPDYESVGVGRDDGKEAGEFSAVFYKKDKFELLDAGSFWLSETPEIMFCVRIALTCRTCRLMSAVTSSMS